MLPGTDIQETADEIVVRIYHASKFHSLISNAKSDGYVYVTTKRVIFRAVAVDSVIHSEIPIENVSGVNMYYGQYRSWLKLLVFLVIAGIIGAGSQAVFQALNFSDSQIISWLVGIAALLLVLVARFGDAETLLEGQIPIPKILLTSVSARGYGELVATSAFAAAATSFGSMAAVAMIGAGVSLVLFLTTLLAIPRRNSMSLAITSKGGTSTPIMLAGADAGGSVFSTAAQALEAEPGAHAKQMIQELGALILDIQLDGKYALARWAVTTTPVMRAID